MLIATVVVILMVMMTMVLMRMMVMTVMIGTVAIMMRFMKAKIKIADNAGDDVHART